MTDVPSPRGARHRAGRPLSEREDRMNVIPLPIDPRTELRLWLSRQGYITAGFAATRDNFAVVVARVPPRDRHRASRLIEAVRADDDALQRDPVLREAREIGRQTRAMECWCAEARQFIVDTRAESARACRDAGLPVVRALPDDRS